MKNDLLIQQARKNSSTTKFFYDLLDTKRPNWEKATDKERIIYLFKYYTCLGFFTLGNLYHSFISWITAYYPFSLLYKDRLFHHDNLKVRSFMIQIEKIAKKEGINILVLSGGVDGEITEMVGYIDQKNVNRDKTLKTLEAILQKEFETVYIRDSGDHFRILIPTNSFEEVIQNGKKN